MRACRNVMIAALLVLTSWEMAQAAPSAALNTPLPTAANSLGYRTSATDVRDAAKSHFMFKRGSTAALQDKPPPRPMDKAVVMGRPCPWLGASRRWTAAGSPVSLSPRMSPAGAA